MPKTPEKHAQMVRDRVLNEATTKINVDIKEISLQVLQVNESEDDFMLRLEKSLLKHKQSA